MNSEDGSPEFLANSMFEPIFRAWLENQVYAHGSILRSEAMNSGAEVCGASPLTVRRYIDKACSLFGPFSLTLDEAGRQIIVARERESDPRG